jgi:carbonic anhydrase/acetyltransferase-like protein (isoleucine patch superfamily)
VSSQDASAVAADAGSLPVTEAGPLFRLGGASPSIDSDAWIAPTATVIGDVTIGAGSGVWFGCILRGDVNSIRIGARSNIQDGTIIHVDPGEMSVTIGDDVTIGHACVIHGCKLETGAFVGMSSTVLNGCVIEGGGVLGAGSLLTSGKRIKTGELWVGAPARFVRMLSGDEVAEFAGTARHYVRNAGRFRRELADVVRI